MPVHTPTRDCAGLTLWLQTYWPPEWVSALAAREKRERVDVSLQTLRTGLGLISLPSEEHLACAEGAYLCGLARSPVRWDSSGGVEPEETHLL